MSLMKQQKFINFIKSWSWFVCLFNILWDEMGSGHNAFLLPSERGMMVISRKSNGVVV